jgi:cell division protein ZapB
MPILRGLACIFPTKWIDASTMCPAMPNPTQHTQQIQLDQLTERVERLLVRHLELQRTNALLTEQVNVLTHERDSLKSRLGAARARVDALLERLPETLSNDSVKETV